MYINKSSVFALMAAATFPAFGQTTNSGGENNETSLFETVTGISKKTDAINLYLNTQADFNADFSNNHFDGGKFEMKQLRIELRGTINDWITYRYRQRLNKGEGPDGNFDNLLQAIDIAEVGFRVGNVNITGGKQAVAYGGIEYDLNPIDVYDYSEILNNMDGFLTGVRVVYDFLPGQQVQFQVVDALIHSSEETYGNLTPAKLPMVYILNWNGSLGGFYNSRWSASFMNETKGKHQWYYALGNDFKISDRAGAYLDWMYLREGVDREGIITSIVGSQNGHNALNAEYMSFVLHMNYFVAPKWNIFAKGTYETTGVSKTVFPVEKGNYRTTWTYSAGVEFYPLKERTLHFFLMYAGRNHRYRDRVCRLYDVSNYHTDRVAAGFIWQIPLF